MVRRIIQHGISDYASPSSAHCGTLINRVLGDFVAGVKYGEFALSIQERLKSKVCEALTFSRVYYLALSWTAPLHKSIKPILQN